MSTLFVSDIHLSIQKPKITNGFLHFLRTRATSAQALYILGDLFEVWIGDDDPNPLHNEIAIALQALNQRNIPCYFIHGNRDFLLGKKYAKTCGITLLPEQQVIQIYGFKIVMLHGDTLCTNDNDYQRFRKQVHQRWLQRLFLLLPLWLRCKLRIAERIRANSLRVNSKKPDNIMDVNSSTVLTVMMKTGATVMIHGHTHRPEVHLLFKKHKRAVLGSWQHKGSAIEVTKKDIILHEFPFCE